jgi:hypothetical protein
MEALIPIVFMAFFFGIFAVIITLSVRAAARATAAYNRVLTQGVPARGILLTVSPTATRTRGANYQTRQVYMDVEIAGHAPFEVSLALRIPANMVRDVLPGATLELRVDPQDRNNIIMIGPGVGFPAASLIGQ